MEIVHWFVLAVWDLSELALFPEACLLPAEPGGQLSAGGETLVTDRAGGGPLVAPVLFHPG